MKLLTEAESLEQSVLKLKTMDWPILLSHDTMSLEVLTATLRSQVDDRKGKVRSYDQCTVKVHFADISKRFRRVLAQWWSTGLRSERSGFEPHNRLVVSLSKTL